MNHFFVAGFDFGTSYSKVVLRDQLTGVAKAVTFGPKDLGLFPSFVRIGEGEVIGPEGQGGKLILSYPKLIATDAASHTAAYASLYGEQLPHLRQLLGNHTLPQVASLILARYFLSVLNGIHQFLAQDVEWRRFAAASDPLVVQIAVPIGLNSADNSCDRLMQRSLAAATLLHSASGAMAARSTVTELQQAFQQLEQLAPDRREYLNVRCITYPEVAAGVHTVLRSPNTPDGKYLTMDVGAGTVDLNAFYRRRRETHDSNAGLDYWSCEVRPLGFSRLHLPTSSHQRQAHELSVNPLHESELLNQLGDAVADLMNGAFRYQPNRVRGAGTRPWLRNTVAFAWGGGAQHQGYLRAFENRLHAMNVHVGGVNRLPRPAEHFALPHDVDFGRLAIAYGLSFHKANLETVRLPRELQTFDELHPVYWHEVVDRSKICSCRGNPDCLRCFGSGLIRPDHIIAPRWISHPATHTPQPPPPKPRVQLALASCIKQYHQLAHPTARPLLIERFLLLQRIRQLRHRPEICDGLLVQQQSDGILNYNVAQFTGRVRLLRFSAKRFVGGCHCVVACGIQKGYADVFIASSQPDRLERNVNCESPHRFVDFICSIHRNHNRHFELTIMQHDPAPNLRFEARRPQTN
jgi:hypothetical protein